MDLNDVPDYRITSIKLQNILSYKKAEFVGIEHNSILIGKNNSGKSNLFKALKFCGPMKLVPESFFFSGSHHSKAEIKVTFTLSVDFVKKFLSEIEENYQFSFDLYNQSLIIDVSGEEKKIKVGKFFSKLNLIVKFLNLSSEIDRRGGVTYPRGIYSYPIFLGFEEKNFKINLIKDMLAGISKFDLVKVGNINDERLFKISHNSTKKYGYTVIEFPDLEDSLVKDSLFVRYFYGIYVKFVKNLILIKDDRNFEYQTEAKIPKNPLNSSGSNFPDIFFNYKNNDSIKFQQLNDLICDFFPEIEQINGSVETSNDLDVSETEKMVFTPHIKEKFHNGRRNFDNLGRGLNQLAIILTHIIETKNEGLLLIEEPELHIHPILQKKIFAILNKVKSKKQIIFSTHSPFFINSNIQNFSLHHVIKKEGYSVVKNTFIEGITEILSDIGVEPSDFLMNNALILVEGKNDVEFLRKMLGKFLLENGIGILPFKGKFKLPIWDATHIITELTLKGFKFVIILDKDEGNTKIVDLISDVEAKKKILFLPVREIENFSLNPLILAKYLMGKFPEKFNSDSIDMDLEDYIRDSLTQAITDEIFWETIKKAFLESQPIFFSINIRRKLLELPKENWIEEFFNVCKDQYRIQEFDENFYRDLFTETEIRYKEILKEEDNWKNFPGKSVRKEFNKVLQENKKINIDWGKIVDYSKEHDSILENFIIKIKNRLEM